MPLEPRESARTGRHGWPAPAWDTTARNGLAAAPVEVSFRRRQFDRAARHYDAVSSLQRLMARRLGAWLPARAQRILELGCGTGHLTLLLACHFPQQPTVVTDTSRAMLEHCRRRVQQSTVVRRAMDWRLFDAERDEPRRLGMPGSQLLSFDLVASGAMVHWLEDCGQHLRLIHDLLAPGGWYLVSSFGPDNLCELTTLLSDLGYRRFPTCRLDAFTTVAGRTDLRVRAACEEHVVYVYPSVDQLLRSVRDMGGSRYPASGGLTPSRLAWLKEEYVRRYGIVDGVRVTWKPWYALLERPR